jgi:hypothetical protein
MADGDGGRSPPPSNPNLTHHLLAKIAPDPDSTS